MCDSPRWVGGSCPALCSEALLASLFCFFTHAERICAGVFLFSLVVWVFLLLVSLWLCVFAELVTRQLSARRASGQFASFFNKDRQRHLFWAHPRGALILTFDYVVSQVIPFLGEGTRWRSALPEAKFKDKFRGWPNPLSH